MPKENSKLYNQIKKSETFEKWVVENYDKIKSGELKDSSLVFPSNEILVSCISATWLICNFAGVNLG